MIEPTDEIIQIAMNLPISDLKELDRIISLKSHHIKKMKFEEAAYCRDEEKRLMESLGIPINFNCSNLYKLVRDKKIDDLLNGSF
jgi:hypothetical protein